jgi:hypothetical protein
MATPPRPHTANSGVRCNRRGGGVDDDMATLRFPQGGRPLRCHLALRRHRHLGGEQRRRRPLGEGADGVLPPVLALADGREPRAHDGAALPGRGGLPHHPRLDPLHARALARGRLGGRARVRATATTHAPPPPTRCRPPHTATCCVHDGRDDNACPPHLSHASQRRRARPRTAAPDGQQRRQPSSRRRRRRRRPLTLIAPSALARLQPRHAGAQNTTHDDINHTAVVDGLCAIIIIIIIIIAFDIITMHHRI